MSTRLGLLILVASLAACERTPPPPPTLDDFVAPGAPASFRSEGLARIHVGDTEASARAALKGTDVPTWVGDEWSWWLATDVRVNVSVFQGRVDSIEVIGPGTIAALERAWGPPKVETLERSTWIDASGRAVDAKQVGGRVTVTVTSPPAAPSR